ncbi:hypothetical protein NKH18_39990 [Streptomyces sp. M10(2022)]
MVGLAQLLAGGAAAFGLIATANVLTVLLAEGPTPDRVMDSLPSVLAVVASYALRGLMESAATVLQGRLRPGSWRPHRMRWTAPSSPSN